MPERTIEDVPPYLLRLIAREPDRLARALAPLNVAVPALNEQFRELVRDPHAHDATARRAHIMDLMRLLHVFNQEMLAALYAAQARLTHGGKVRQPPSG